ncbi:PAS domain-containing protein [Streptomyces albogriseolus]|nr:PAS domain-containing protein [Streptomyces albogriseolus]
MSSRPSRGAARLAAILDALPDALVLVNANGTVVNANTIALEAFEAPGTALVGRGLLDLLPEFDSKLIPGSMRRPDHIDPRARTKPTRMTARRTDGTEFPVEVTSANLENTQHTYDSYGYTGDELLMLVVRDLSGTVDTEAELARSQRQTEMILRAASEGVVGTDTDGRIVLVNPAAAQILGYRAGELGGRELHTLVLHSRADGSPFPYSESPLADTLRSGRKHRVRGQVLYAKNGDKLPVDLTTAPVRDGDQLVGAVMTFLDRRPYDALVKEKEAAEREHAEELERLAEEHGSELTALRQSHVTEVEELREKHAEELAAHEERYAALGEREKDRYEALAARHEQLLTLLGRSLRGPLDELRRELSALAADDAGQLWPEANQVLHHLSAGYSRITTLIDNVLGYQRLDAGTEQISRTNVMLDAVVAAGVDGAVELIGPGRVQFAVHAPPIEAEVDARLLATALAHLVADVAGVDATGNTPLSAGGYLDNTVVVAAAQRGEVVRIEVRGPYGGGDPVHEPVVRGIVRAHGGVLQTHEVPGMSGSAFVLEVPIGGGAGSVPQQAAQPEEAAAPAEPAPSGGRRRARRASVDAFLESDVPGDGEAPAAAPAEAPQPTGRRRRRAASAEPAQAHPQPQPQPQAQLPAQASGEGAAMSGGTGRRRGRPAEDAAVAAGAEVELAGAAAGAGVSEGAVVTAAEHAAGAAASNTGLGGTVPPQGVPAPSGRRARRAAGEQQALAPALPAAPARRTALPARSPCTCPPRARGPTSSSRRDGAGVRWPPRTSGRRRRRRRRARCSRCRLPRRTRASRRGGRHRRLRSRGRPPGSRSPHRRPRRSRRLPWRRVRCRVVRNSRVLRGSRRWRRAPCRTGRRPVRLRSPPLRARSLWFPPPDRPYLRTGRRRRSRRRPFPRTRRPPGRTPRLRARLSRPRPVFSRSGRTRSRPRRPRRRRLGRTSSPSARTRSPCHRTPRLRARLSRPCPVRSRSGRTRSRFRRTSRPRPRCPGPTSSPPARTHPPQGPHPSPPRQDSSRWVRTRRLRSRFRRTSRPRTRRPGPTSNPSARTRSPCRPTHPPRRQGSSRPGPTRTLHSPCRRTRTRRPRSPPRPPLKPRRPARSPPPLLPPRAFRAPMPGSTTPCRWTSPRTTPRRSRTPPARPPAAVGVRSPRPPMPRRRPALPSSGGGARAGRARRCPASSGPAAARRGTVRTGCAAVRPARAGGGRSARRDPGPAAVARRR